MMKSSNRCIWELEKERHANILVFEWIHAGYVSWCMCMSANSCRIARSQKKKERTAQHYYEQFRRGQFKSWRSFIKKRWLSVHGINARWDEFLIPLRNVALAIKRAVQDAKHAQVNRMKSCSQWYIAMLPENPQLHYRLWTRSSTWVCYYDDKNYGNFSDWEVFLDSRKLWKRVSSAFQLNVKANQSKEFISQAPKVTW